MRQTDSGLAPGRGTDRSNVPGNPFEIAISNAQLLQMVDRVEQIVAAATQTSFGLRDVANDEIVR